MKNKIEHILHEYGYLIPRKEYAGIITLLYEKTQSKDVNEVFTYDEIELCAYQLNKDKGIQIEKALQFLLTYFLRKHSRPNSYFLTQYAKNFVALISDKVDSPYRNLPLKKNFEKYFQLNLEDIKGIDDLKGWFELGFNKISKNIVSEHIETLQDELDKATIDLNKILHKESIEALELVKQFSEIFKTFGARSREIREVLNLKNSVHTNLRILNKEYYGKLDSFTPRQRGNQQKEYRKVKEDWELLERIIIDVKDFFNQVDIRLDYISNQIIYASEKLDQLNETFDNQSLLKVNLKKMMRLALENAEKVDDQYILANFPLKKVSFEQVSILAPQVYDFELDKTNTLIIVERDMEYEKTQLNNFKGELDNQERTSIWIDNLNQKLNSGADLELSKEFQAILTQEENIEIPMQVSYEILNRVSSSKDYKLNIQKVLQEGVENEIKLWKTTIKKQ